MVAQKYLVWLVTCSAIILWVVILFVVWTSGLAQECRFFLLQCPLWLAPGVLHLSLCDMWCVCWYNLIPEYWQLFWLWCCECHLQYLCCDPFLLWNLGHWWNMQYFLWLCDHWSLWVWCHYVYEVSWELVLQFLLSPFVNSFWCMWKKSVILLYVAILFLIPSIW